MKNGYLPQCQAASQSANGVAELLPLTESQVRPSRHGSQIPSIDLLRGQCAVERGELGYSSCVKDGCTVRGDAVELYFAIRFQRC